MRLFVITAAFAVLSYAQDGSPLGATAPFFERTVSQLSSLTASSYTNKYITLTDGANACDLTIGGGSFKVPVVSNGTSWSAYGCAGSGGGTTLFTVQGAVIANVITQGPNCGPGSAACPLYIGNGTQVLKTAPATGTPVSSYNGHTGTAYGCANATGGIYLAVSGASLVAADITGSGLTVTSGSSCTQGDAVLAVFSVTSGTAVATSNPALVGFGNTNVQGGTNMTCTPTSSSITCSVATATTSNLGVVQPDGTTIGISAGVISVIGGATSNYPYLSLGIINDSSGWTSVGQASSSALTHSDISSTGHILVGYTGISSSTAISARVTSVSAASNFSHTIGVLGGWQSGSSGGFQFGVVFTDGTKYASCMISPSTGSSTNQFFGNEWSNSTTSGTAYTISPNLYTPIYSNQPIYYQLVWTQSSHTMTCNASLDGASWVQIWTDTAPYLTPTAIGYAFNPGFIGTPMNFVAFGYN